MRGRKTIFTVIVILCVMVVALLGSCAGTPKRVDMFWDSAILQNVTRLTDDGHVKFMPRVSPDGRMMLYSEARGSQWNIVLFRDVNVPAKTQLVNGIAFNPAWYANNNNFVYASLESGSYRLIRSAITGGGRTYITRNPVGRNDNMPSVRGEVILFQTETASQVWQIATMKDNGTEITFLGDGYHPSWHPSLPKFVFIRQGNVMEMDLASLQVTEIYNDPLFNSAYPSYSADGQYILFQKGAERKVTGTATTFFGNIATQTRRVTGTTINWQIFIMNANGTNLSTVTLDAVDAYHPSMDRNGFIYFISNASGKPEIYRARVSL